MRQGVANRFRAGEPLRGWRHVTVRDRRTPADCAHVIQDRVDVRSPDAECLVLVLDNLNSHAAASRYATRATRATLPPAEARRRWQKLEVHYPPSTAAGWIWPSWN